MDLGTDCVLPGEKAKVISQQIMNAMVIGRR
jgi:hypothetical protein